MNLHQKSAKKRVVLYINRRFKVIDDNQLKKYIAANPEAKKSLPSLHVLKKQLLIFLMTLIISIQSD